MPNEEGYKFSKCVCTTYERFHSSENQKLKEV